MASLRILTLPLATLFLAFIVRIVLVIAYHWRKRRNSVGFFHPYTNDGGGGERVLWCAVKAVQELSPDLECVVYTGDHDASPDSLAARAVDRFGVKLLTPPKVHSVSRHVSLSINCLFLKICMLLFVGGASYWLSTYVQFLRSFNHVLQWTYGDS